MKKNNVKSMDNKCNIYTYYLTIGTIVLFIIIIVMLMLQVLINMMSVISMSGGL